MRSAGLFALLFLFLGVLPVSFAAEEIGPHGVAEQVTVAIREAPPFAMRDTAGNWEGLSVELWQDVADKLKVHFEWRELDLPQTIEALESGGVDLAIAALTVTSEREERIDFSYPYFTAGLGLAVDGAGSSPWRDTLRSFFSLEFLSAVLALAAVLLLAGAAVWYFERRANSEMFERRMVPGLASAFWWSAVTMTTVGYGDKAPVTLGGRLVALVWMFTSIIIIAGFTAAIASSITVNRLESDLLDERRLTQVRVAVLANSSAAEHATERGLRFRSYDSVEDTIAALHKGQVDAVLHDAPVLRYAVRSLDQDGIVVLPGVVTRNDYAFGMPPASPLRKPVNVALLSIIHEPVWQNIRRRYLGADDDS